MFKTVARNKQNIKTLCYRTRAVSNGKTYDFVSVYPEVITAIFESDTFTQEPQHKQSFMEILDHNLSKKKLFNSSVLLETYAILERKDKLTDENLRLANILAWSLELVKTYINISDDVIEQNEFRDDRECWHKNQTVGLIAFHHAVFFYQAALSVLTKYFSNTNRYTKLYDLLHRTHFNCIIGQTIQWKLKENGNPNFKNFNLATYRTLGEHRTGFIFVEAPFQAAHTLAQSSHFAGIKNIIREIAYLYQIENDVLDIYQNGKMETGIRDHMRHGRCTWMAVQVLERGSSDLVEVFTQNYNRSNLENEKTIIDVYLKMDLYSKYIEHREKVREQVLQSISQVKSEELQKALLNVYTKVSKN